MTKFGAGFQLICRLAARILLWLVRAGGRASRSLILRAARFAQRKLEPEH